MVPERCVEDSIRLANWPQAFGRECPAACVLPPETPERPYWQRRRLAWHRRDGEKDAPFCGRVSQ